MLSDIACIGRHLSFFVQVGVFLDLAYLAATLHTLKLVRREEKRREEKRVNAQSAPRARASF
jgi:hypothetical protein